MDTSKWVKFRLATPIGAGDVPVQAVVCEVRLPRTCPWWAKADFEEWKEASGSKRDLEWEEFPIEEYIELIFSKNRSIPTYRGVYPAQRFRFAMCTDEHMAAYEASLKNWMEQKIDPSSRVDEVFLRSLGFILDQDMDSMPEAQIEGLVQQGYRRIYLADGTGTSLMPWSEPSTYISWVPLGTPDLPSKPYNMQSKSVLGCSDFNVTDEWFEIINAVYTTAVVQATGQIATTT